MAYPFEPTMLSSPGAGSEGWRHDGFSQVAAGVRAPVPGRGGLRRVAAGAPLGIGLRLPGVRPRPLLAARAQGLDLAVQGLPARDLGDGGHGHAPQPPAAEGLVHRRLAGGDAPERDVGAAAAAAAGPGPSLRSVGIFGHVSGSRRIENEGFFGASRAILAENPWHTTEDGALATARVHGVSV